MTNAILDGAERATRPSARKFQILDGIRGLCALCVLLWHLPKINPLSSAYLAVDLFFMMSGFVLALRYEDRLRGGRGMASFMLMRLIRLYPLYLLGSLIGAAVALAVLVKSGAHWHAYAGWSVKLALAAMVVPQVIGRAALVFPFNVAAWSLFYELVVNAGFGLIVRVLRGPLMAGVILASGASLFAMAWIKGDLRLTGEMPYFLWGSLRAVFGFCVGVQLFRLWRAGRLPRIVLPPVVILLAVLACLAAPRTGAAGALASPAIVAFAFPLIIAAGIENEPSGVLARLMTWTGVLSFPLYAIHFPLLGAVELFGARLHLPRPALDGLAVVVCLIAAALASELFDKPCRRWLTAQAERLAAWRHRGSRSAGVVARS